MRRGIAGIIGSRIASISRCRCRKKPILVEPNMAALRRRTTDQEIVATGRLGKRVLVRLENDESLVFEPRMTGLVLVTDPPTEEHLRVRIELTGGDVPELLYWDRRGLGSVRLFNDEQLEVLYGPGKLGVDALEISAEEMRAALGKSRREVKVALLDQQAVAGIGNLYASEILHLAGVHPAAVCSRLNIAQWEAIHTAMRDVLTTAIRYEGSTLGDGTYRNALNQQGSYQNHHRVYDRAGEHCLTCHEGTIKRIVQAQRSTFFCSRCQTKRPKRRR